METPQRMGAPKAIGSPQPAMGSGTRRCGAFEDMGPSVDESMGASSSNDAQLAAVAR